MNTAYFGKFVNKVCENKLFNFTENYSKLFKQESLMI